MSNKEVLDGIEKALDATEARLDEIIDASTAGPGRIEGPHLGYLAVAATLGLVGGATVGWYMAKRHYQSKYEALAEQEIAEAKEFYARLHKTGEYSSPESVLTARGIEAAAALKAYQQRDTEPEEEVVVTETRNLFADRESSLDWNQEEEDALRAGLDAGEPFIISHDEFMANENDYQNPSLAYFAEDDILVDEQEKPIELIDQVVGEDNLTKFGHGSQDNRVLYIRNDKLGCDFEIIKNDGSYTKEVLGLQHSDGPRVRKMRGDDG